VSVDLAQLRSDVEAALEKYRIARRAYISAPDAGAEELRKAMEAAGMEWTAVATLTRAEIRAKREDLR
jgi:hypothetical protein